MGSKVDVTVVIKAVEGKTMRFNRGSIEEVGRAAIDLARRTGRVQYIVPSGNGLQIESKRPVFVNFHTCFPDGRHEYHEWQTGCPAA